MDQATVDLLYDALNAPYAERVRKQVRLALTKNEGPDAQFDALIKLVERLALTPPPDPEPLPLIEDTDIHLIGWMAIVPPTRRPAIGTTLKRLADSRDRLRQHFVLTTRT